MLYVVPAYFNINVSKVKPRWKSKQKIVNANHDTRDELFSVHNIKGGQSGFFKFKQLSAAWLNSSWTSFNSYSVASIFFWSSCPTSSFSTWSSFILFSCASSSARVLRVAARREDRESGDLRLMVTSGGGEVAAARDRVFLIFDEAAKWQCVRRLRRETTK